MTVIYEFPLKQTPTGGNREQWREQYQSHFLLGWPNTPGEPLVCESCVPLCVCVCVCLFCTCGGGGAGGRKIIKSLKMSLSLMAEENNILEEFISCDDDIPH